MTTLTEWTLAALLHFARPELQDRNPWADPTAEAARERYQGIAETIAAECADVKAKRSCAALLAAIAIGESGLARDADLGPCYRQGAYRTRCDSGAAASVWQVHAHGFDARGEDITIARIFSDRALAAWLVHRIARGSLARCSHLPEEDRLAGLGGNCTPSASARARWKLWKRIEGWAP